MNSSLSLRARLTLVILGPLIVIAALFGAWAYFDAQNNAAERFDRSLLSTALAISRDIAATGGDLPSEDTRDLLRDTSGGTFFITSMHLTACLSPVMRRRRFRPTWKA